MMRKFIGTTKALADLNRVRIVLALRNRELCVCRIIELLQLAPSTVSKHLSILKEADLIEGRKEGRWMHYRLPNNKSAHAWNTLDWIFKSLENSPDLEADRKRLAAIIETDLEELTQIYRK